MLQPAFSNEEIAQQLVFLEHQISLLQLEASMWVAELDRSGFLEDAGYNSPTDWLRFNCHLTDKVAGDRVRVGEHLAKMPMSVDYLRDAEIGYSHLAVIARTAEAVGKAFDERPLLELALEHTPGKFYYKSLHYRHSVDAKKYADDQADEPINHHLSLSTGEDGHLLINGVLDPVGGAAVRSALEPLAQTCWGPRAMVARGCRQPAAAPALRRRPGRAGLGGPAGQPAGHRHDHLRFAERARLGIDDRRAPFAEVLVKGSRARGAPVDERLPSLRSGDCVGCGSGAYQPHVLRVDRSLRGDLDL